MFRHRGFALPTKPQGVIWLGGAAIRARYERLCTNQGVDASQIRAQTKHLREVLTDQSDRGHHANVQKVERKK